jgi:hypothetical protein
MKEADEADPWDILPWEEPGNCRRDAEPHRAPLLRTLGNIGFFLAVASCYPCLGLCVPVLCYDPMKEPLGRLLLLAPAEVLAVLALVVGVTTAALASRDIARMREGLVDPNGKSETEFARRRAAVGVVIGLASVLGGVLAVSGAFGL